MKSAIRMFSSLALAAAGAATASAQYAYSQSYAGSEVIFGAAVSGYALSTYFYQGPEADVTGNGFDSVWDGTSGNVNGDGFASGYGGLAEVGNNWTGSYYSIFGGSESFANGSTSDLAAVTNEWEVFNFTGAEESMAFTWSNGLFSYTGIGNPTGDFAESVTVAGLEFVGYNSYTGQSYYQVLEDEFSSVNGVSYYSGYGYLGYNGEMYDVRSLYLNLAPGFSGQFYNVAYESSYNISVASSGSTPGPVAVAPFALGLLGALRRRKKA
jgi:MYXO-CTERM domain-containing protein